MRATLSPWRSSPRQPPRRCSRQDARHCLGRLYARVVDDTPGRIADTLEILMHDGYLEDGDDGYRFPSRLLKDWWSARFRDHHILLENRHSDDKSPGDAQ